MKRLPLNQSNYQEILKIAVRSIKNGDLIVCPTDTVYGFCCNALDKKAVKKLFKIKERPKEKPIPIFAKDIKTAKRFAYVNEKQKKFLKNPKITSIFKPKNGKVFPAGILSQDNKIGIRIPNYRFLNVLLRRVNFPLTGTSANVSGQPASAKIKEIIKQFGGKKFQPDLVIDVGNLKRSRPSKVIDLTGKAPKILRK